jgi:Permeases of the drug/metabolite transporter (DMT) superfamily
MKSKELRSCLILLLAAGIWGFAFVAQRVGSAYLPTFEFNGVKFSLGALSLIPVILLFQRKSDQPLFSAEKRGRAIRNVLPRGVLMGVILFIASTFQQYGIYDGTSAGKAGFITGLYTVLVPIFGMFLGRRSHLSTWISAVIAAAGIFLISVKGNFTVSYGDLLELIGAVFWAVHILVTDRFSKQANNLGLSFLQFAVCGLLSLFASFLFETPTVSGIYSTVIPVLYGGILSVGVAFTLQIVGQRSAPPAPSAIIMSMESLFAALGGFLILGENLGFRAYIGCALMIFAIILSQYPSFKRQPQLQQPQLEQPQTDKDPSAIKTAAKAE